MSKTSNQVKTALSSGHPAGIWVLCTTEMWERFAFYAMRALLVLYLTSVSTSKTVPGFGWSEADANYLYGIYTCLVYFLPILGGWVADRFLGQFRCVLIGGVLMAVGEFFLAATEFVRIGIGTDINIQTDPLALWTFYAGLALMILGNGFFKPCISVMVGQLYHPDEPQKRDAGFSFFYMGINIGAFLSPLVAGTVAEKYGFHLGFIIAGIGMIFGLITFLAFRSHLKGLGLPPKRGKTAGEAGGREMTPEEKIAHEKAVYEQTRPLVRQDWDRMFVIVVLSLFVIAFWVAFEQAGSSLTMFAKVRTDRTVSPSVAERMPAIVTDRFLIADEYRDDLEAAVKGIEKSEKSIREIFVPAAEETKIVQETFSERIRRLFSFAKDDSEKIAVDELLKRAAERPFQEPVYTQNLLTMSLALAPKDQNDETSVAGSVPLPEKQLSEQTRISEQGNRLENLTVLLQDYPGKKRELDKQVTLSSKLQAFDKSIMTFPASWYQSANPLWVVIFAPIFIFVWGFLAKFGIEPSTPTKFALGLILLSIGFFLMIPGAVEAARQPEGAGPHWLIICYIFCTWGELCLSPVGLSMVSKLAPARLASMFMGIWFLASSAAYFLAGAMAAKFGSGEGLNLWFGRSGGTADFFLLMGLIPAVIGLIALCLAPLLKRMMHGIN
ncbi:MAG: peptide MFS transporter [Planctomycetaceae bacterium]|nr:peptide MFS transporter [Planctomycetaceae bacterium]